MSPRRHPAEVTADRLLGHLHRWDDRLGGFERNVLDHARSALHRIAAEDREAPTTRPAGSPDNHTTETR